MKYYKENIMDAIVFVSNTGFTAKYAEMLSAELGYAAMTLKDAKAKLAKGSEIIFLGWISAGLIRGLGKARKLYEVKAVGGVGMGMYTDKVQADLIRQNKLEAIPAFYLQGGLNMNKLKGFNRFAMKMMGAIMSKTMQKDASNLPPDTADMLDAIKNPKDYVSADKLAAMLSCCKTL